MRGARAALTPQPARTLTLPPTCTEEDFAMLQRPWTPPAIAPRKRYRWTYADLEAMPETAQRTEIIDGDLIVSPSPNLIRHQLTVMNLGVMLRTWVRAHKAGRVFVAPADVVLTDRRVVQPDVFFVSTARLHLLGDGAAMRGAPDLVIEVLSPSNARLDRTVKFKVYEEEGVPECWIVDPKKRTVEVFALGDDGYARHAAGGAGETVRSTLLDGFAVLIDDVFEDA